MRRRSLTMTYDALNEHGTFSEGDTITGQVTLVLLKQTSVQSLVVKVKGDADVRWTRKNGDHKRTYSAHRRYFKLKQFLIPADSKGMRYTRCCYTVLIITQTPVPQGKHVYKFSFNIPPRSMPSSFRGCHGKIVYKLEAALARSWRMDRTVDKEINFVSKAFPNLQSLMSRQVGTVNKEMGLFSKGHVQMDVSVDRRAYAPVLIVAQINNSSSSDVTPKLSLIKEVLYRADTSTRHDSNVIHKVVENSIKPQTQKEVRCAVKIPPSQMQTIQNCEIISVEYYFKVYLDISFSFDPEVKLPLVIIPPDLAAGPYPAGATGGPSNSDFPPPAVPLAPYPASLRSGLFPHRFR
uniref:Arrestin C-terminal-like domain-containing protein n=1 Tax=Scophthalmus maximus TaxID=52904 RepID=A0A8D3BRM7_SCOMX